MKNIFILVIVSILIGCSSTYIEPPMNSHNATFTIVVDQPFRFNAPFGMIISAEIDGRSIDTNRFVDLTVRVAPGKHILTVAINAYYYNRAKYYLTQEYEIYFKENETYIVSSKVESAELKSNTDNVAATLFISGAETNISEKIMLEDSSMRSMVCQVPDCKAPIILFL